MALIREFGFRALLIASLVVPQLAVSQESKIGDLLKRTPAPANAVIYMHVPSLKKLTSEAEMKTPLSDEIEEIWAISNLQIHALVPQWEAGYATLNRTIDSKSLAQGLKGYVDEVNGKEVVWTPNQSYLVPIENGLGFLRPANRPLLSSWLSSQGNASADSYLLEQSRAQSEKFLSLMLGLELENAFSPVALAERLKGLDSVKNLDAKVVSALLGSVRGISIIVGRQSLKQCILSVDFGSSPQVLEPVARELLNEILNKNGTAAPEVLTWDVKVAGNRISYQGPISEDSLHGILGIFSLRQQAEEVSSSVSGDTPVDTSAGPNVYASKKYFDRVLALIERVRKYEAQSTGYRAKWNEQNARRIDELSTVGVDPDMIDYGSKVSDMLRENSTAIRNVNVSTGQTQASQGLSRGVSWGYGGYGGGYYGGNYAYGYYDANKTTDYQRVSGAQAAMAGFGSFQNTISAIDQLTGDTRRAMTTKYGTQF